MRVYHFSEIAYPQAWDAGRAHGSFRVTLNNQLFDPALGGEVINRHLDEFMLCDDLGLDIMLNEHHSTATCLNSVVPLLLAILARQTKTARLLSLGTPIANRPDPVRIAEEMAMIDVISRGRLEMGLVKGAPFEIAPANSVAPRMMDRFWEAHDLILKAMTHAGGPFNWEGEYFHYRQVNIWPRPLQQPHPPVWITALSPDSAGPIAERRHIVATLLSGTIAKNLFDAYRRKASELGWIAGPDRFAYAALIGVGETEAEGLRRGHLIADYARTSPLVAEPFRNPPGYSSIAANVAALKSGPIGFVAKVTTRDGKPIDITKATVEEFRAADTVFAGTPDQVYAQIKDFHDQVGGFSHLIMMGQGGWLDRKDTEANLTLFAREVLPRLRELSPIRQAPAIRAAE